MKNMIQNTVQKISLTLLLGCAYLALMPTAYAANPVDLAMTPLPQSGTTLVKPNLLFILDDSGSMTFSHLPDSVYDFKGKFGYQSSQCNGLYYEPDSNKVEYLSPYDPTGSNQYPNATFTAAREDGFDSGSNKRNLNSDLVADLFVPQALKPSGNANNTFGVVGDTYSSTGAVYYEYVGSVTDKDYERQRSSTFYNECNTSITDSTSGATTYLDVGNSKFKKHRLASAISTDIIVSGTGSSNAQVTSIKVNGVEILTGSTAKTSSRTTMASNIKAKVGNGYSATVSGSTVTITGPNSAIDYAPIITSVNTSGFFSQMSFTTDIFPDNDVTKLQRFANWYSYYRTRMLTMKTAVGLAFKDIDSSIRVGFMNIANPATGFMVIDDFTGTRKNSWFSTLYTSKSQSIGTPLRSALSVAGRIYAHTAGSSYADPMQYTCQPNFSLLTTDGYWNADANSDVQNLSGGEVGDVDSDATRTPRPQLDATKTKNTLADVAKYYHDQDIRNSTYSNCTGALGNDVCTPANVGDQQQHMNTLTLGLGAQGYLTYSSTYKTDKTGDFVDLTTGAKNWPVPSDNSPANIDDLWHAAVNGSGTYFSAGDPQTLVDSLKAALAEVSAAAGAGASAGAITPNPAPGKNASYIPSYTSVTWTGNIEKRKINITTGEFEKNTTACVENTYSTSSCVAPRNVVANGSGGYDCVEYNVASQSQCAGILVGTDCKVSIPVSCTGNLKNKITGSGDSRTIYMSNAGSLVNFSLVNIQAALPTVQSFNNTFLASNFSQGFSAAQLTNLTGDNLVAYLRGATAYQRNVDDATKRLFRTRSATLGDIVTSAPVSVSAPPFNYGDAGYYEFKTANSARAETIYVGANDGMLHAFDATDLTEKWAYVPTMAIPNMWLLADTSYNSKHRYYVDGDIKVHDICTKADIATCTKNDWRTILVSGLGGGGRAYFALDITSPTSPELLWEYDASSVTTGGDNDLGYSYSKPVVTKRHKDGKWVVMFASGYNNIPDNDSFYNLASTKFKPNSPPVITGNNPLYSSGNGGGYLYVLDAVSGALLNKIATGSGSTGAPSGLGQIAPYVTDNQVDNTTQYVYSGDLNGDMWKFDIDSASVSKFAHVAVGGTNQPITVRPTLAYLSKSRVLFFGTGKYLEISDLTNTSQQTFYAIKDGAPTPQPFDNPRGSSLMVPLTLNSSGSNRTISSSKTANFNTDAGWYIDLTTAERQHIDSQLAANTLAFVTTVPTAAICKPEGHGYLNYLDIRTGLAAKSKSNPNGYVSTYVDAPPMGFALISTKDGVTATVFDSKGGGGGPPVAIPLDSGGDFLEKRSIWREVIDK
ncbi:MAG: PilC/PilY family type IV pilus protein [Methylophilus sp.]|jgi:type IV pilus assembly protein PilY1